MAVIPRDYERTRAVNFFSLSIADEQHKSFYGRDGVTQTEVTEIRDLQEMTAVMKRLVKESAYLHRELTLSRQSLQAEYEAALEQKTSELYRRCNEQVRDLEELHEERVGVVRRSFKQQLSDALISLSNQNAGDMLSKMKPQEKKEKPGKDKLLELKLINEELEKQIQDLQEQLDEAHQHIEDLTFQLEKEANAPRISQEDMDKLNDEIAKLRDRIRELDDEISRAAGNTEALKKTIEQKDEQIDKISGENAAAKEEIGGLKQQIQDDAEKAKQQMIKMREELEKEMAAKVEKAKEEAIAKAKAEFEAQMRKEKEEFLKLKSEVEGMEKNFKAQLAAKDKQFKDSTVAMKRAEKQLRAQLEKVQKELDYQEKAWAKRFEILQQSNQQIREETATRGALRRYVLKLKHAEVMYRSEDPLHYLPPPQSALPLPEIGGGKLNNREGSRVTFQDDVSVTMSYDSDHNLPSETFDEQQIDLDKEGIRIIEAFIPLPGMDQ